MASLRAAGGGKPAHSELESFVVGRASARASRAALGIRSGDGAGRGAGRAAGRCVPFVRDNLHAPIAIIFLYAPAFAARRAGREFDYATPASGPIRSA